METENLKKLSGRLLDIALGVTDLPSELVDQYREEFERRDYDVPPKSDIGARQSLSEDLSSVGTFLHSIIKRETGHAIPCPVCLQEIFALNKKTAEQAASDKETVVDGIHSRAWDHAGWQDKMKLAASFAVQAMTVGHVDAAKNIIGGWFDEAIEKGAVPAIKKKN
jgi:hypothetical protein